MFSLSTEKKSEVKEDEVLLGEEEPPFTDDLKDQSYEPQAQRYITARTHAHQATLITLIILKC